jgi:hypothetical protein
MNDIITKYGVYLSRLVYVAEELKDNLFINFTSGYSHFIYEMKSDTMIKGYKYSINKHSSHFHDNAHILAYSS